MKTQQLCGLFLLATAASVMLATLSPQQQAIAKSGPQSEKTREHSDQHNDKHGDQHERLLSPKEELGKKLFFDKNLSMPRTQACASCHDPGTGFTSPSSTINAGPAIVPGAVADRAGNRKPPTVAYAGDSPVFHFEGIDGGEGRWVGGLFCDGRATGLELGDPLVEQALGPFLNEVEQNLPDAEAVLRRVAKSDYAKLFEQVWGPGSLDLKDVQGTYEKIGRSIAAYERSPEVSAFSSKYDYWLQGKAQLTEQETLGLELFNGKAACFFCHTSAEGDDGKPPLFTDFTFHNIGTPKNLDNPFYQQSRRINPDGQDYIDPGLGGFLRTAGYGPDVYEPELGKHKVPTLRNVDRRPHPKFVRAYGHNGTFKSLEEIVHFYNTRDVEDWPAPEVEENANVFIGDLRLTDDEEAAVVAFLKTLTDGHKLAPQEKPNPQKQDEKPKQPAERPAERSKR